MNLVYFLFIMFPFPIFIWFGALYMYPTYPT